MIYNTTVILHGSTLPLPSECSRTSLLCDMDRSDTKHTSRQTTRRDRRIIFDCESPRAVPHKRVPRGAAPLTNAKQVTRVVSGRRRGHTMRFGKQLEATLIPEWEPFYIHYKVFKKHLAQMRQAIGVRTHLSHQ